MTERCDFFPQSSANVASFILHCFFADAAFSLKDTEGQKGHFVWLHFVHSTQATFCMVFPTLQGGLPLVESADRKNSSYFTSLLANVSGSTELPAKNIVTIPKISLLKMPNLAGQLFSSSHFSLFDISNLKWTIYRNDRQIQRRKTPTNLAWRLCEEMRIYFFRIEMRKKWNAAKCLLISWKQILQTKVLRQWLWLHHV